MESVRNLVLEETDKLIMRKLSSLQSQSSVQELLRTFVRSDTAEVFVLLANMQETTCKTINHVRVMFEEVELTPAAQHCKMFVLLLHFPPAQFFQHCYPTLFLKGWDHCYLDAIGYHPIKGMMDIRDWFFKCCFPAVKPSHSEHDHNESSFVPSESSSGENSPSESGHSMPVPSGYSPGDGASGEPSSPGEAISGDLGYNDPTHYDTLVHVLSKLLPQTVSMISSRVNFGDSNYNNCSTNASRQSEMLKTLFERGLGEVLCDKFRVYWTPKVMTECLERAARFSQQRESTLNLTDTVQTHFKALFINFCVYMLTLANNYFSLDSLHAEDSSSSVHRLFIDILRILPVPELHQLIANDSPSIFNPPVQCHFPFFMYVYKLMERQVKLSQKAGKSQHDLMVDDNLQTSFSHAGSSVEELMPMVLSNLKPLLESKVSVGFIIIMSINSFYFPQEQLLSIAVVKIASDKSLWKHYFTDFISHKLKLVGPDQNDPQEDNIAQQVWHTYFEQLHESEMPQRLVALHCYASIYHVYLAKMAIILHPLSKIERVRRLYS